MEEDILEEYEEYEEDDYFDEEERTDIEDDWEYFDREKEHYVYGLY